jgi:hypothetical protein
LWLRKIFRNGNDFRDHLALVCNDFGWNLFLIWCFIGGGDTSPYVHRSPFLIASIAWTALSSTGQHGAMWCCWSSHRFLSRSIFCWSGNGNFNVTAIRGFRRIFFIRIRDFNFCSVSFHSFLYLVEIRF